MVDSDLIQLSVVFALQPVGCEMPSARPDLPINERLSECVINALFTLETKSRVRSTTIKHDILV
jgi:hypothetical protein